MNGESRFREILGAVLVLVVLTGALPLFASATAATANTKASNAPTLRSPWHTATSINLTFSVSDIDDLDSFVITDGSQTWEQSALQSWQRTLTHSSYEQDVHIHRPRPRCGRPPLSTKQLGLGADRGPAAEPTAEPQG
jgi:hypothetical protein